MPNSLLDQRRSAATEFDADVNGRAARLEDAKAAAELVLKAEVKRTFKRVGRGFRREDTGDLEDSDRIRPVGPPNSKQIAIVENHSVRVESSRIFVTSPDRSIPNLDSLTIAGAVHDGTNRVGEPGIVGYACPSDIDGFVERGEVVHRLLRNQASDLVQDRLKSVREEGARERRQQPLRQMERDRFGQAQHKWSRAKEIVGHSPESLAILVFVVVDGEAEFLKDFEVPLDRSLTSASAAS